jgi:hypothetical protein
MWCDALHLIHITENQSVKILKPKRWCFPDYASRFVKNNTRFPKVRQNYGKNQAFCESCGIAGHFSPILTNVFANIELCEDCVNEDEELSCHKWEIVK